MMCQQVIYSDDFMIVILVTPGPQTGVNSNFKELCEQVVHIPLPSYLYYNHCTELYEASIILSTKINFIIMKLLGKLVLFQFFSETNPIL